VTGPSGAHGAPAPVGRACSHPWPRGGPEPGVGQRALGAPSPLRGRPSAEPRGPLGHTAAPHAAGVHRAAGAPVGRPRRPAGHGPGGLARRDALERLCGGPASTRAARVCPAASLRSPGASHRQRPLARDGRRTVSVWPSPRSSPRPAPGHAHGVGAGSPGDAGGDGHRAGPAGR
jgi:hypothetical protein